MGKHLQHFSQPKSLYGLIAWCLGGLLLATSCGNLPPAPTAVSTLPATPNGAASPTSVVTPPTVSSPTPIRVAATAPATPTATNLPRSWNFDADAVRTVPAGMTVFAGQWQVHAEAGAPSAPNALCQVGRATFPAIALHQEKYGDVSITARFIAISGQVDRAGGFFFRAKDKDNFYILRANALEDNYNFYTFIAGSRALFRQANVKVESGKWHELRVEVAGNRMRGYLNGSLVVEATNDVFKEPGLMGLWTKEDSVSCFDDVSVRAL